jgi:hypothetical protein
LPPGCRPRSRFVAACEGAGRASRDIRIFIAASSLRVICAAERHRTHPLRVGFRSGHPHHASEVCEGLPTARLSPGTTCETGSSDAEFRRMAHFFSLPFL